jgi:hypothetical protein
VSNSKRTPPAVVIEVTVDGDTLTLHRSDTILSSTAGTQADLLAGPPPPTVTSS